ncbi:hypothetical protein D3C85_966020 [compost metagenome]
MGVVFQQRGEPEQDVLALARLQLRPAAVVESLLGGGHGHIDILHVARGDLGQ